MNKRFRSSLLSSLVFRLSSSEDKASDQAQTCCNERDLPSASSEAHQMKYLPPYNYKATSHMTIKPKNIKKPSLKYNTTLNYNLTLISNKGNATWY